jgi:hypothetical protein
MLQTLDIFSIFSRDENPTGPGFGVGPKTLIFGNFKNPEPGPDSKPESKILEAKTWT